MTAALDTPFTLLEIEGKDLSAAAVKHAIDTYGVLLVRQCIPRDAAIELDQRVAETFAQVAKPEGQRDAALFNPIKAGGDFQMARVAALQDGCALMIDTPLVFQATIAAYRDAGVLDVLTRYFNAHPVLSRFKATLRRTRADQTATEYWHQDGAFMGADMRVLNIWLALTPCGVDAASVEIAGRRFSGVIPCDHAVAVSAALANTLAPTTFTPTFEPGDALLFDHLCLHRTSRAPTYTRERRALEMWFFDPEAYPRAYDPEPVALP